MSSDLSYRLDSQVGIVTGSANGIGRELAIGLAEAGADIVIADLPVQRANAEDTARNVQRLGRQALTLDLDVTSLHSIEAVVETTVREFGKLDFLVNNAGTNIRKPVLEYSEAEWEAIVSVNLKGAFFCSQAAGRQMREQKRGKIVNIASQLAAVAMEGRSIYAISKAGVAHMTKAFALELAPHGITVNSVGPTFVSTPMTTSRKPIHPQ